MNILFLTTHANTGGITSYILTLGESLVKAGHKVWVISSGGDCVPAMEAAGILHLQLDIRTKSEAHPKLWLKLFKLNQFVRREGINIIHAQTRVTQVLGDVLSRLSDVKMVTTCHGFFRPRWFRRTFPCWGEAVIAISQPVAKHLSEDFKVPAAKICLIFNGIDLDRFKPADTSQRHAAKQRINAPGSPLIGIIARLSDVKGIDVLIKAMPSVLKRIPQAHLMIVGQGPQEDHLKKLTQELSLSSHVHFNNTINQTPEVLSALDIFVMPSLMEGLGLSVMEAQACGLPVVASRIGGLVDLIEDGVSGYLVPVGDTAILADRIVDLLENSPKAQSMAQEARVNIETRFSAKIMTRQTIDLYEQYSSR